MSELTLVGARVVHEVGTRGSFTAAADALGYTQSAVSRQVQAMEHVAGAPLFERHARGVRPTAAGRVFLRHAAALLGQAEAAQRELGGVRDRLEGRLTVGAIPTSLNVLVPHALARLGRAHPGIEVVLREGTTPEHLRDVRAGRDALAVVAMETVRLDDVADLRAEVLLEGGLCVAVAEDHPLARQGVVAPGALEGERWIVADQPAFGIWPGVAGEVAHRVQDWPARLGLVAAGLGIAIFPSMAVGALPPGVRLVAVDSPRPGGRAVVVVTGPDRSPNVAALATALHEEAALVSAAMRVAFSAR